MFLVDNSNRLTLLVMRNRIERTEVEGNETNMGLVCGSHLK